MPVPPTLSQRKLATLAGVSHITVSRALRDDASVAPETKRRVLELAEKHGYRPNPMITALMEQLRHSRRRVNRPVIGYLVNWRTRDGWRDGSTKAHQREGAQQRAVELGYTLTDFWLGSPNMTSARLADILQTRWVQGLMVAPQEFAGRKLDFVWGPFASATTGYSYSHAHQTIPRACHDHHGGMRLALGQLRERGYRSIGYVTTGDLETRANHNWWDAFAAHQMALGPAGLPPPLLLPQDPKASAPLLKAWYGRHRPEVIVTVVPFLPALLVQLGIDVPGDVSLVHLDVSPDNKAGFTGVNQRNHLVGAAAIELIVEQINHNARGLPEVPKTIHIPGVWIEGRTLKPLAE